MRNLISYNKPKKCRHNPFKICPRDDKPLKCHENALCGSIRRAKLSNQRRYQKVTVDSNFFLSSPKQSGKNTADTNKDNKNNY